ncbi:GNAT family N-acetyltransferase, partial [Pseudomonas sp. MPR-R1B]|uniref:GNAT family N-acetyltransferase n=1 Tax=Pseudomonas sp. MPR-R1B TaxID=2070678 RepID=UPI0011AF9273
SQMLHERDDARLIVAESRGELAGVVSLRQFDVTDATNPLPVGRHVSIEDISVQASLRGQGLGRALVQATYDAFRDSKIAGYS